jgi:SAM-dependent methyltransferase
MVITDYCIIDASPISCAGVSSERDSATDLAAQIRAAVAETAAESPRPTSPALSTGWEEEAARSALHRALAHVTPTIPAGAPLERCKRLSLRLLRFLWREQAAFNALSLEAATALVAGIAPLQEKLQRLSGELARAADRYDSSRAAFEKKAREWSGTWERRAAIQDARLASLEAASPVQAAPAPGPAPGSAIPAGVYSLFEERFRGTPEEIAVKQRGYLPFLEGVAGPVLDVGCGRGEFLKLLSERGIAASGIDLNPIAIEECRKAGLQVEQGDGVAALASRPAASLGAVVALQVVEHWAAETIFFFLREAWRALAPGGVLIAETINVDSLSAWRAFYLDFSHVRPVPPEALRFLAEAVGFADTRIEYRACLAPEEKLTETSENDAKLNRLLFGPQDYALIARVP